MRQVMSQNRNKLIELLISHLSNSIIHSILEKSYPSPEVHEKYKKEVKNSINQAKKYRDKIHPSDRILPDLDITYIKDKVRRRVNSELILRISKGYKNIDLNLINEEVNKSLRELNMI